MGRLASVRPASGRVSGWPNRAFGGKLSGSICCKTMAGWLERFWAGCGHCREGGPCPLDAGRPVSTEPPYAGCGSIPVAAGLVFLLPLGSAILFGHLADRAGGSEWLAPGLLQAAGMAGGFLVGVLLAKLGLRLPGRRARGSEIRK